MNANINNCRQTSQPETNGHHVIVRAVMLHYVIGNNIVYNKVIIHGVILDVQQV